MRSRWARRASVLAAVCLLSTGALAQRAYRCTNAAGVPQWSDRPCGAAPAPELAVRGASDTATATARRPRSYSYSDTLPGVMPPEAYVQYLSPGCAQIQEAMRTGPSRGVRYDTLAQLRREYQQKCGDEDLEARRRADEKQRAERDARQAQRSAEREAKTQAEQEVERCKELQRLLNSRRARAATMTEGEKADLRRFEESYAQRCQVR